MLQERSTAAVGGERGGVGLLIVMVVNSGKCLVERDGSCDLVTGISGELQLRPESSSTLAIEQKCEHSGRSENGGINEGCRALSKCSPATKKSRRDEKISAFVDFSARALEHLM